jgi:hypothetical protein
LKRPRRDPAPPDAVSRPEARGDPWKGYWACRQPLTRQRQRAVAQPLHLPTK